MNRSTPIIALALWIAALGFATCARATDPPALPDLGGTRPSNTVARAADAPALPDLGGARTSSTAQDSLATDAVCTKCHDENDNKAILSIYQTRHGVKADARTPSCQSCHGTSDRHVKNTEGTSPRPSPEVVFGGTLKTKTASAPDAQNQACLGCHQAGQRVNWSGSEHQSHDLACSTCHQVHSPTDAVLNKVTQPEVCETCHKTQRAQFRRISTHPVQAGEMGCSDCHNPHGSTGPKLLVKNSVNETCMTCHQQQRAEFSKRSHMPVLEGKMTCVDCHNPHGSTSKSLLKADSVNEACYQCHAEKRGPFLWEHSPVVDDCTNCHTPHGSTNPPLLTQRVPFLCQDCHSADHGAGINSGANLLGGNVTTVNGALPPASQSPRAQVNARACLNCHVLIHGSNHPAGTKFQR